MRAGRRAYARAARTSSPRSRARPERTARCSATSATSTPCSPTRRTGARPVVRRPARRLRLGPRRDRHEVPGRRRGGRRRRASPARAGARRRGALKVFAVVDEETGGARAPSGSPRTRPDLARCDYLLNEGAGTVMPYDGRRLYGVCVRREGHVPLQAHRPRPRRPRLRPRAGRQRAAQARCRWSSGWRPPRSRTTSRRRSRGLLRGLGEDPDDPAGALERIRAQSSRGLAPLVRANCRHHDRPDA